VKTTLNELRAQTWDAGPVACGPGVRGARWAHQDARMRQLDWVHGGVS